jgi:hypothetical protein
MIPLCSVFLLTGMDSQWPTGLELLFLNCTFYPTEQPLAMLQQLFLPALRPFENPVQGIKAVAVVNAGNQSGVQRSWQHKFLGFPPSLQRTSEYFFLCFFDLTS